MGVAAHFTIVLVFLAIGLPALIYACISYFGQAKQDTRIDMEALNLQQETNARTAKDMQLMTQLAQETTNRITSDTALNASIALLRVNVTTIESTPVVNNINNLTGGNVTFVGGPGLNLNVTNNSTIVIGLRNTTVIPGRYSFPTLVIDPDGRISNATNGTMGTVPAVTLVNSGVGLTGGPINSTGTLSLANTTVVPGNYIYPSLSVNPRGQITSIGNNTAVTTVTAGIGLTGGNITLSGTIGMANTTVVPGSYVNPSFVVNERGQLTSATNNSLTLGGDVSGILSTTTVNSIQGAVVSVVSSGTYGVRYSLRNYAYTKSNYVIFNTAVTGSFVVDTITIPLALCAISSPIRGCAVLITLDSAVALNSTTPFLSFMSYAQSFYNNAGTMTVFGARDNWRPTPASMDTLSGQFLYTRVTGTLNIFEVVFDVPSAPNAYSVMYEAKILVNPIQ